MSAGAGAGAAAAAAAVAQAIKASGVIVRVEPEDFFAHPPAAARPAGRSCDRWVLQHELPVPVKLQGLGILHKVVGPLGPSWRLRSHSGAEESGSRVKQQSGEFRHKRLRETYRGHIRLVARSAGSNPVIDLRAVGGAGAGDAGSHRGGGCLVAPSPDYRFFSLMMAERCWQA